MNNNINNMIEYIGIKKFFPKDSTSFKQFSIISNLCIPDCKPSIKQIVKVSAKAHIKKVSVIKTPTATSIEGQVLTGYKALVCGNIEYIIVYSNNKNSSLHSSTLISNFCEYIVLPENFLKSTPISAVPYIEDICIVDDMCGVCTNDRCFNICSSIFLDIKFCCDCNTNLCNISPKIIGLADKLPSSPIYFKETTFNQSISINQNCPIKDIISINSKVEILSSKIVETIEGSSIEGQILSGYKLVLELQCIDIIIYSTNSKCDAVNSVTFNSILPCIYIILPKEIDGIDVRELNESCALIVKPYIEGVCLNLVNDSINKCCSLFIDITTKCM